MQGCCRMPRPSPCCAGLRRGGQDGATTPTGPQGRRCARGHADQNGPSVSPQETGIPEELLVTVVKPGLPTLADLHVLLPPPGPTRKRSLTSDKVRPVATRPR